MAHVIRQLDVQHGTSFILLNERETIIPICTISVLFFLWGLLYGLLSVMNYYVTKAMHIGSNQASILVLCYFAAYIPGSLIIGSQLVWKAGYRVAMVVGMTLVSLGALFTSIAAWKMSFTGMAAAQFCVGLGISTLERSANPYATNCGPRYQAAFRLLFCHSWAGTGTVVAPLLAKKFIFVNQDAANEKPAPIRPDAHQCVLLMPSTESMDPVVTFYRILAAIILGVAAILTVVFFRTSLVPEVTQSVSPPSQGWKVWQHPLASKRYLRLWWGLLANFLYNGCQVAVAQFFIEYMVVNACTSSKQATTYLMHAQIAFVAGRLLAAALISTPKLLKPRIVLLLFTSSTVAFSAASIMTNESGTIAAGILIMFCEGPMFPMIFEITTAGVGEWKPVAESLTIMSLAGGGVIPVLMGYLNSRFGISKAWFIIVVCFSLVSTYALANNILPTYRRTLDCAELADQNHASAGDVESIRRPSTGQNEPAQNDIPHADTITGREQVSKASLPPRAEVATKA